MVAAIQDGVIGKFCAVFEFMRQQSQDDRLGFVLFFFGREDAHLISQAMLAPQVFIEQLGVVLDQMVCALQYALRRTVILFQFDYLQVRVIALQILDVRSAGTAPGINGLIVITHRSECCACATQQFHQLVLASIGILVFVHQDVAQTLLPAQ